MKISTNHWYRHWFNRLESERHLDLTAAAGYEVQTVITGHQNGVA